ncbi:MAG: glycosyltransferase [bacterium]|nr:glycosyltransferase [bacterium]
MVNFIYFIRDHVQQDQLDQKCCMWIEQYYKKTKTHRSGVNHKRRKKKLIVSLTTIPSRLDTIWITLESLFRQSYKADKIILWVADEIDWDEIYKRLGEQIKRGLEIRQCENLGPHKKYFYTFQEFHNDLVVTVDDDVIYSEKMLEGLVKNYVKKPDRVYCYRSHQIQFRKDGTIKPYSRWLSYENRVIRSPNESRLNFFTGAGGVLYPTHLMPQELFNADMIQQYCWRADDVWLYMHMLKNNIPICNVNGNCGNILVIERSQKEALWKTNLKKSENDEYIAVVGKAMGVTIEDLIGAVKE